MTAKSQIELFQSSDGLKFVHQEQILYAFSKQGSTKIFSTNGRQFISQKRLTNTLTKIGIPYFVKVHSTYAVILRILIKVTFNGNKSNTLHKEN
jgi:DNA-binding LytR/AlgR family response regulator